jgi:hypothetical protein
MQRRKERAAARLATGRGDRLACQPEKQPLRSSGDFTGLKQSTDEIENHTSLWLIEGNSTSTGIDPTAAANSARRSQS